MGLSEMSNTYSWQAGREYNMNVCRFQNVRKTGSTFFFPVCINTQTDTAEVRIVEAPAGSLHPHQANYH